MKIVIMVAVFVLLLCEVTMPGDLYGRIIQENGRALARTVIVIETDTVTTNGFGGYKVTLPDGTRELKFVINGKEYMTDSIKIYSPKTKQNWKMSKDKIGNAIKLKKVK